MNLFGYTYSDHNGEILSQNGDNESLYLHDLKNVVYDYYYVAYAFVQCFVQCV